jgi:cytochrome c2
MKPIINVQLLIFCLSASNDDLIFSQAQMWKQEIGSVYFNNCTACHHISGLATFHMMI